jgi:1-deoxy-D-xylulose-5-phosphate synthase
MTSFLEKVTDPFQIKSMSLEQLEVLALDIRQRIIEVMSINGGHLASNLGIVELTIALHKVFNSPIDKFLFDTSHQTYPHKILTGRNNSFHTIRKFKGLSGFASPDESPHDHFFAGHAGTALSLALGMVKARDLNHQDYHVLPVLGDAALTCGLTHEALNNIPKHLKNFIIILNDNAMAISKNVGAITSILNRVINNPTSNKLYREIEHVLRKIPGCKELFTEEGHKLPESLKNLVSTAPFFEQYGLSYIGPIDGHNLKKLIHTLESAKNAHIPCLIHVFTVKGQGMPRAIENPTCYHGARPFERLTGKFLPNPSVKPTFPKIFGQHILKMADENPHLVALTPAMPAGSCLTPYMEKYPDRCLDVGIAEGHCVTFAGGLAYDRTKKVVVCVYATFLQRALDNLFQDVCLQKLPVIFALDRGGLAGGDGVTHNGIYDIAFLNAMPNILITQPRNGQLLKELLQSALHFEYPTVIRYPNLATEDLDIPLVSRPIGRGEILSPGSHLAIIALGHKCETALQIKALLKQEEIDATVVDPIFIKPLDQTLFTELFTTHPWIVTLEEHSLKGGLGSIVNQFAIEQGFYQAEGSRNILNLGIPELYVNHGSHTELTKEIGLDAETVVEKILEHFTLKSLTTAKT